MRFLRSDSLIYTGKLWLGAAPAKAEEMYSPETFGRSSGQTVLVE